MELSIHTLIKFFLVLSIFLNDGPLAWGIPRRDDSALLPNTSKSHLKNSNENMKIFIYFLTYKTLSL